MSAQPCGCDPECQDEDGHGYTCEWHRREKEELKPMEPNRHETYFADHASGRDDLITRHLDTVINRTWNFAGRCISPSDHLLNAILGLAGESGECADTVKKLLFHSLLTNEKGEEDERLTGAVYVEKLVLELGDVFFYWAKTIDEIRVLLNLSFPEAVRLIIARNREKLESRHPELGKVTERFGKDAIR